MATSKQSQELTELELDPRTAFDVIGDPPLLWRGVSREFTPAEAESLLALRDSHGVPLVRIVPPRKARTA